MLEHTEDYSEAHWQDILCYDECRGLYTLMAKTMSAIQPAQITDEEIDAEWERLKQSNNHQAVIIPLWRKIAAAAAILIALFGISYAAIHTNFFGLEKNNSTKENKEKVQQPSKADINRQESEPVVDVKTLEPQQHPIHSDSYVDKPQDSHQETEEPNKTAVDKMEPQLYDNVPLELILGDLAKHYNVEVEYLSNDVCSLRLYYQWEPDYSLDKVVEMLSHFETFIIHREGDKLIVESSQEGKQ